LSEIFPHSSLFFYIKWEEKLKAFVWDEFVSLVLLCCVSLSPFFPLQQIVYDFLSWYFSLLCWHFSLSLSVSKCDEMKTFFSTFILTTMMINKMILNGDGSKKLCWFSWKKSCCRESFRWYRNYIFFFLLFGKSQYTFVLLCR
jgi:hypothetical protein